jgi:hypothetical protein
MVTVSQLVGAQRYLCLRCEGTFRVYPKGVSRAQQSNALKAFSVLLSVLGLSYGAVSDALELFKNNSGQSFRSGVLLQLLRHKSASSR